MRNSALIFDFSQVKALWFRNEATYLKSKKNALEAPVISLPPFGVDIGHSSQF